MVRPTSLDRPDGVTLDTMREGEDDGVLYEYIRFVATDMDAGEAFADQLDEACVEWTVRFGHNTSELTIELYRKLQTLSDPPMDSPEVQQQLEAEAQYYKGAYEAQRAAETTKPEP